MLRNEPPRSQGHRLGPNRDSVPSTSGASSQAPPHAQVEPRPARLVLSPRRPWSVSGMSRPGFSEPGKTRFNKEEAHLFHTVMCSSLCSLLLYPQFHFSITVLFIPQTPPTDSSHRLLPLTPPTDSSHTPPTDSSH